MTTTAPDIRDLTDDELAERFAVAEGDGLAALIAEAARRDRRAEQSRKDREWWARVHAEWYDMAYAQYLQADAECRGNLLSRAAIREGVADEISLWSGPRARAMRLASEELRDFWEKYPRVTVSEYAYAAARPGRGAATVSR